MTREEAINEIKSWDFLEGKEIEAIQTLIPELAESEDERIRKELKEAFEAYDIESMWNGIPIRSIFAWLEKQKEQKPAEFTHHEIDESLCDAVTHQMEDDGDIDDFVRRGIDDIALKYAELGAKWQKEQKPAEWSDEDKKMLLSIINAFRNGTVSTIGQEQWLKSLHKRFNLQPKPEWSEEDEDRIRQIERIAQQAGCTQKLQEEIHDWFKSLRPHRKPSEVCYGPKGDPDPAGVWKPSKEQMEAFKKYIEEFHARAEAAVGGWNNFDVMIRLYEQLKKL